MASENQKFLVIGVPFDDGKKLAILCPFCGDAHTHGSPLGGAIAHCNRPNWHQSYRLVQAPFPEMEDVLREVLRKRLAKRGYDLGGNKC